MDEATKRSLTRENEAADTLAKNGHDIEQNPKVDGTTRNPDYCIEGEMFDCYSPAGNTKVRNVASTIEEKVIEKGQANRVVLNLDDWNGEVKDLIKQLYDYPIEGLEEVLVIKDGVVSLYILKKKVEEVKMSLSMCARIKDKCFNEEQFDELLLF